MGKGWVILPSILHLAPFPHHQLLLGQASQPSPREAGRAELSVSAQVLQARCLPYLTGPLPSKLSQPSESALGLHSKGKTLGAVPATPNGGGGGSRAAGRRHLDRTVSLETYSNASPATAAIFPPPNPHPTERCRGQTAQRASSPAKARPPLALNPPGGGESQLCPDLSTTSLALETWN